MFILFLSIIKYISNRSINKQTKLGHTDKHVFLVWNIFFFYHYFVVKTHYQSNIILKQEKAIFSYFNWIMGVLLLDDLWAFYEIQINIKTS